MVQYVTTTNVGLTPYPLQRSVSLPKDANSIGSAQARSDCYTYLLDPIRLARMVNKVE